jgi:hypothetical protein
MSECKHLSWAWARPYAPEGSDISWICEGCGLEMTQTEMDAWMPHDDPAQLTLWGSEDDGTEG